MPDIEEINKKSSLGFLKSGIEIICKNKKTYHFTGFSDREAVYELIQNIWKGSNGGEEIVTRGELSYRFLSKYRVHNKNVYS